MQHTIGISKFKQALQNNSTIRVLNNHNNNMATKGYDSTTSAHHHHHSSIALLQERFRQLQRAKEMRKEKELLRLFSEPAERTCTTNNNNNSATRLFPHRHHHSTRAQTSHHHQGSIYLQPNLQSKQGFQGGERTTGSSNNIRAYYNFEDYSDVDTSLHL